MHSWCSISKSTPKNEGCDTKVIMSEIFVIEFFPFDYVTWVTWIYCIANTHEKLN